MDWQWTLGCCVDFTLTNRVTKKIRTGRVFRPVRILLIWHFRVHKYRLAPRVGFEPTTNRLTADRSTTELPGNILIWRKIIHKYRRGGIRTLGTFRFGSLVNCCNRPLYHPSIISLLIRTE